MDISPLANEVRAASDVASRYWATRLNPPRASTNAADGERGPVIISVDVGQVSGGRIVMLSTPWSYNNFYSDVWHNNDNDWHKVKITADDCPRITKEAIEIQRANMLSLQSDLEHYCSFQAAEAELLIEEGMQPFFSESVEQWSLEDVYIT